MKLIWLSNDRFYLASEICGVQIIEHDNSWTVSIFMKNSMLMSASYSYEEKEKAQMVFDNIISVLSAM